MEAKDDHANNLWNTMLPCDKVNLKFNPSKFQFNMNESGWMGYLLSAAMEELYPEGKVHCGYKPEGSNKIKGSAVHWYASWYVSRHGPISYRNGDAARRQGLTPSLLPFRILTKFIFSNPE